MSLDLKLNWAYEKSIFLFRDRNRGFDAHQNREAELADLTRRIFDSQNILLYAHRRTGKSSLIHNLITSQEFKSQVQRYKKMRDSAYIQQFLSELWYVNKISLAAVDEVEESLLRENQPTFIKEWDMLTVNQKKTLKLIVTTDGKGMFTTENLQSVGFSSPGMLTRTLKSLVEKDIIRKNDAYKLQDPIFKKWLMLLSSKFRAV